jgi:large conductance mechanosensitive channel
LGIVNEFKAFVLRGNVVELAVALIIGLAFTALVTSLVEDLITPLIAAIAGETDFSALTFEINNSIFRYGSFFNSLIAFLLIALVVFFLVVKPVNYLVQRMRQEPTPDPTTRKCSECLSEIPVDAPRCAFCASEQRSAA